jgi:hypothetical protein
MFTSYRLLAALTVTLVLSGCAADAVEGEAIGEARSAVEGENAMVANAMVANAMVANAMVANAMVANAMVANSLDPNVMAGIQDPSPTGDLNRMFLRYAVGCAFNPSQSFSFSWTDALGAVHDETYQGALGLAPGWAYGPLWGSGQRIVSACLAARTNYFGVTVHLSVRGAVEALRENTSAAELAAYPYVEGAFWGNLFSSSPGLYACYNPANVAHSRADQRDCATGYLDSAGQLHSCGPIVLTGSCDDQCLAFDPWGQFYVGCGASYTMSAITVGLQ